MKNLLLATVFVAALGCASTNSPTTQPSLATLTTQAEAATDAAVNAITEGGLMHVISPSEFWTDIDPIIHSIRAAEKSMEAHAEANDATGWQAADDALNAGLTNLQPYLTRIATTRKNATTKGS